MGYGDMIVDAIRRREEWGRQKAFDFISEKSRHPEIEEIVVGNVLIRARIEAFDRYGLLLGGLEIEDETEWDDPWAGNRFDCIVARCKEKLPKILGEFEACELDEAHRRAVLRTKVYEDSPSVYFELEIVGPGRVHLRHYEVENGRNLRCALPANLSMAGFNRLVDALANIFTQIE